MFNKNICETELMVHVLLSYSQLLYVKSIQRSTHDSAQKGIF